MSVGHAFNSKTSCQKGMTFGTLVVWALLYISAEIGELWRRGSLWGAKILKGVKKNCNAFLWSPYV